MSQYMSIVLRDVKANRYLTLASYSRNHPFQQFVLNDAPFYSGYMEAVKITTSMIDDCINTLNILINKDKELIANNDEQMKWLSAANNELSEKLEALNDLKNSTAICNEEIGEYKDIIAYLCFLYNMIDYNDTIELYIGIEIGTSDGKLIDKDTDNADNIEMD